MPNDAPPIRAAGKTAEAGFSLIEVLVATTLFMVVTGAIYGLLSVARSDRFTTNQRLNAMQSVRNALNQIKRDALNAGFGYPRERGQLPDNSLSLVLGIPADADTNPDRLTPIVPGVDINANDLTPANDRTDQVTFVWVRNDFNNGNPLQSTQTEYDNGNGSRVRVAANGIVNANEIYLLRGGTMSAVGRVTGKTGSNYINFFNGGTLNINRLSPQNVIGGGVDAEGDPIGVGPASLYRLEWVTYRVLPDGTLVRSVHGDTTGGTTDMAIAYGVESMEVRYVLTDGDVVESPAKPEDICQVRVSVRARGGTADPRNGQQHTVTMAMSVNTRNVGYDAP